jgi:hypothetical protein
MAMALLRRNKKRIVGQFNRPGCASPHIPDPPNRIVAAPWARSGSGGRALAHAVASRHLSASLAAAAAWTTPE